MTNKIFRPRDSRGRFISRKAFETLTSTSVVKVKKAPKMPSPKADAKAIRFTDLVKVGSQYRLNSGAYKALCAEYTKELVDQARSALVYTQLVDFNLEQMLRVVSHPKFTWGWLDGLVAISGNKESLGVLTWVSNNPGQNIFKRFPSRGYAGISKEISAGIGKADRLLDRLAKSRKDGKRPGVGFLPYLAEACLEVGWIS